MADVTISRLSEVWETSRGDPFTLFQGDNPPVEAGSYVIEPGERIPETGTTSHNGDELSVILSGEIDLVADGSRYTVTAESLTVIPAGTNHYSENRGDNPVQLVYVVVGTL